MSSEEITAERKTMIIAKANQRKYSFINIVNFHLYSRQDERCGEKSVEDKGGGGDECIPNSQVG